MPAEATQTLIERMKTDEAFRERLLAEPSPEARLALIRTEGYDCSADDLASAGVALSDADLEHVAAGNQLPPWDPGYTPFG